MSKEAMKAALRNVGTFAALCAVLWCGVKLWELAIRHSERDRIAQEESIARFDSLLVASKRLDKAQAESKKTVIVHATKYQTLRDTLRLTDTVAVGTALAEADTTIKACFSFISACEAKQANLTAQVGEMQKQRDYYKAQIPGPWDKAKKVGTGIVIGVVVGNLLTNAARR